MILQPPTGTSTPSWRKVAASGMGTPRSRLAGAPCSSWTQGQDLSKRTSQDPGDLEGPGELLVHGPEGTARARLHAQLQRQGQHDRLGDEIETFEIVDTHPCDSPSTEATNLQENLRHRRPIQGTSGGAEAKGRRVGPGLLTHHGIRQAHTRP